MLNRKVGFIGSGNMAHAMLKGIIDAKIVKASNVYVFDIDQEKIQKMKQEYGIVPVANNLELVKNCDIIFGAVKPNILGIVLEEIREHVRPEQILISVAAGWTTEKLRNAIERKMKVLKVMPNTPAMVGEGVYVLSKDNDLTLKELEDVKMMLSSNGLVVELEEERMFAVTGVSGVIPACVSMYIEALADAGVYNGLTREFALKVAAQAVMGSAKMVLESSEHPGRLKDQVCTPAGTTIHAVTSLEEDGFRGIVIRAANRSTQKSYEMSQSK